MKKVAGAPGPTVRGKRTSIRDRAGKVAAASVTTIIALQGTAFAAPGQPAQTQGEILVGPVLGPGAMAAAGAVLATLAAYRLRKQGAKKGVDEGEK